MKAKDLIFRLKSYLFQKFYCKKMAGEKASLNIEYLWSKADV